MFPFTNTSLYVGFSRFVRMFRIVDFPHPEGPRRVSISLSFKEKLMSFSNSKFPSLVCKKS